MCTDLNKAATPVAKELTDKDVIDWLIANAGSLKLRQLAGGLTAIQAWGIAGFVVTVLGAAVGIGYWLSSLAGQAQDIRNASTITDLKEANREALEAQQTAHESEMKRAATNQKEEIARIVSTLNQAKDLEEEERRLIVWSVLWAHYKMVGKPAQQQTAMREFQDLFKRLKGKNKLEVEKTTVGDRPILRLKDYRGAGNPVDFSVPQELLPH